MWPPSQSVAKITPIPPSTMEYNLRHQEIEGSPGQESMMVVFGEMVEGSFSWYTGGGKEGCGGGGDGKN